MKWIKQYYTYIKETKSSNIIDSILDKINDIGYDSLSSKEKDVLNNLSQLNTNSIVETEAINWLNNDYSNLERVEGTRNSIGRVITSEFFMKDEVIYMELEKTIRTLGVERKSNTMYIDAEIWKHLLKFGLTEDESIELLKIWLVDCYSIDVTKIKKLF